MFNRSDFSGYEKHRTGRNSLNICERIEIHEFHIARKRRMCGSHRGCSFGSKLSPLSAVELIKFAFYRTGVFCHFVYSATGIFSFSAQKLCIALFCCLSHDLFPLFQSQRMFQSVTTGCTHIVHADGCNRFQTRVYLDRTDSETSAATNSDYTYIIPVDERTCTQKIYCGTEILRTKIMP